MPTSTANRMVATSLVLSLVSSLVLSACSSSYTPQSRGRVSMMMMSGQVVYVRDGQTYPHGFLGGGLEDAVAGHPVAVGAAEEYTDRLKLGLLGLFGGMICSVTAMTYALRDLENDPDTSDRNDRNEVPNTLWLSLGCSVVMLLGAGYMASAEPYRWDAVNLFNDAPPQLPTYPGAPPPYQFQPPPRPASAAASLRMRDD
ncbi:MAG: hypothetical protein H0T89_23045 [Deltaproteobacteria bacterium]|nr:hypothetical protein [Deltaproteobacteria bacterium]